MRKERLCIAINVEEKRLILILSLDLFAINPKEV